MSITKLCPIFVTPGTIDHQAPLSMGFPQQEYWIVLPFPPPEDLSNQGIKPVSPAGQADFSPLSHLESPPIYTVGAVRYCLTLLIPGT